MNIKVRTKECPFIYGHMDKDAHNQLTPSSQWKNNRKRQMLIVLNLSSWSHVSPILSRVPPDAACLGKDLNAGKGRLFKHQIKGQSANEWIERLNHSYFTLHWVFLSSSVMAKASWPAGPFHTENQLINMHCMSRHWTGAQNSLNSSHSVSLKRLSKFMSRKYVFWIIQTQCTLVLCGPCCEILGPLRISHWTAK